LNYLYDLHERNKIGEKIFDKFSEETYELAREVGHNVFMLFSRLSKDNQQLAKILSESQDQSIKYYQQHTG